jgi:thiol-disulfide isomerase/thioredoxin
MRSSLFVIFFFCSAILRAQSGWLHDLDFGLSVAQKSNKLAVVDFWATWCGPCKQMDAEVWNTREAIALKDRFVPIKIDIDLERSLAIQYGVRSIPMVLVMDHTGKVIHSSTGYQGRLPLLKLLAEIPDNVNGYYASLSKLADQSTEHQLRDVGLALQLLSLKTPNGQLHTSLLIQSATYFKKARKVASSDDFEMEMSLWLSLNDVYRNRSKKSIKELQEIKTSNLSPRNEALFNLVSSEGYRILGDSIQQKNYLELFRQHPSAAELPGFNN